MSDMRSGGMHAELGDLISVRTLNIQPTSYGIFIRYVVSEHYGAEGFEALMPNFGVKQYRWESLFMWSVEQRIRDIK